MLETTGFHIISKDNPYLVLTNILIIIILYLVLRPSTKDNCQQQFFYPRKIKIATALIFIFCIFSFWGGDWFHYIKDFHNVKTNSYRYHLENVYIWIIKYLSPNYITFRLYVWGTSILIAFAIFKRTSINYSHVLFFFSLCFLIWFSYSRVSLALAILFLGFTIIINNLPSTNLHTLFFGWFLIAISFFFHKSAFFGIFMCTLVILTKDFRRQYILLTVFSIPIIIIFMERFLDQLMIVDLSSESGDFESNLIAAQQYLTRSTRSGINIRLLIGHLLERIPYYLTAFICLLMYFHKDFYVIPKDIKAYLKLTFFLVLGASIFAFNLGHNTSILYTKFIRFTSIPCAIVLTWMWENKYYRRLTLYTIYIAIMSVSYTLIYTFYARLISLPE